MDLTAKISVVPTARLPFLVDGADNVCELIPYWLEEVLVEGLRIGAGREIESKKH